MAKPISIGPLNFKLKKDALKFIREIRDSYRDSEIVSAAHASFLTDLLELHPEAVEKVSVGIRYFTVELDTEFRRNRHFVVHRIDGTHSDFSFPTCLERANPRKDTLTALRQAVKNSVLNFRSSAFARGQVRCPFLDCVLDAHSCHVDHVPPLTFLKLVGDWLDVTQQNLEDVRITLPRDNQLVATMIDPQQEAAWIDFHDSHAELRITSKLGNLSHAKKR